MTWLSYYLTWPLVALAIVGLGLVVTRALLAHPAALTMLGALLAPTALYLWSPTIIPDQVWAIRRLEPAALPLFALAAAVGLWWARDWWVRRRPGAALRASTIAAGVAIGLPLSTYVQFDDAGLTAASPLYTTELTGSKDQLESLCDIIDGRPVLLAGTSSHFGSLRVMCDVPVVLALGELTPVQLTQVAAQWPELVVVTREPDWFTWTSEPSVVVYSEVYQSGHRLQGLPTSVIHRSYSWRAGVVGPRGSLTPLEPAADAGQGAAASSTRSPGP